MKYALILAAGTSTRFDGDKVFASLWGRPLIEHVLLLCEASPNIDSIHVAYKPADKKRMAELCTKVLTKPWSMAEGGASRFKSSVNLIKHISKKYYFKKTDFLVFLNGANPLQTSEEIEACIAACKKNITGAAVGRLVASSLKRIDFTMTEKGIYNVVGDIDRNGVCEMETPQVARARTYADVIEMIEILKKENAGYTDELAVLNGAGEKTALIQANNYNLKITTSADLHMMNGLITSVGVGEDSHGLVVSKKLLMLGGVAIDSQFAFDADSDGDVILHAIANALSSSLGGGSLGTFATAMCEDGVTDSRVYVTSVLKKMKKNDSRLFIAHLAVSIEGSHPAIDPHAPAMRAALAKLLEMPGERIGITATSGKSHSAYGKGQALKATVFLQLRF